MSWSYLTKKQKRLMLNSEFKPLLNRSSMSVLICATRASRCWSWALAAALVIRCCCRALWAFSWSARVPSADTTEDCKTQGTLSVWTKYESWLWSHGFQRNAQWSRRNGGLKNMPRGSVRDFWLHYYPMGDFPHTVVLMLWISACCSIHIQCCYDNMQQCTILTIWPNFYVI